MPKIKIISLNIEGSKHLKEVEDFLISENPDVVCIQELFLSDLSRIQEKTGWGGSFSPMTDVSKDNIYKIATNGLWGLAIFSKWPFSEPENYFYRGEDDFVPEFKNPYSPNRLIMKSNVQIDGYDFPVANTHFTWSVGGKVSQDQRHNFTKMKKILEEFDQLIFCGDFNSPRGSELYDELGRIYQDALPSEVDTTIDPVLHKAGGLKLVVDGVFASSDFEILSGRTQSGISDHKAVIVELQNKE